MLYRLTAILFLRLAGIFALALRGHRASFLCKIFKKCYLFALFISSPIAMRLSAFSVFLGLLQQYAYYLFTDFALFTQRGVWSPRGHFVFVPYGRLFTMPRLRGYIARYICDENTITRLYIAFCRQCCTT